MTIPFLCTMSGCSKSLPSHPQRVFKKPRDSVGGGSEMQIPKSQLCQIYAKNYRPGSLLAMRGYVQEPVTYSPSPLQWLQAKRWPRSTALAYRAGSTEHSSGFSIPLTLPPGPSTAKQGFRACGDAGFANVAPVFSSLGDSELAETAQVPALCRAQGLGPLVIIES